MSRSIRILLAVFVVSLALGASACADSTAPHPAFDHAAHIIFRGVATTPGVTFRAPPLEPDAIATIGRTKHQFDPHVVQHLVCRPASHDLAQVALPALDFAYGQ